MSEDENRKLQQKLLEIGLEMRANNDALGDITDLSRKLKAGGVGASTSVDIIAEHVESETKERLRRSDAFLSNLPAMREELDAMGAKSYEELDESGKKELKARLQRKLDALLGREK